MAQTKHEIQAILARAGGTPRKRFGQNFMIDQNLVRLVAEAGQIAPDDVVIEVGPGTGTLTEELLSRAGKVLAVEIDRDLARVLRERFGSNEKFELIEGDALDGKHALGAQLRDAITAQRVARPPARAPAIKLVANLPYNIASPLAIELLIEGVELLAFTVQKEVADRLRAEAGTEAYGPLTVMAQLLARVKVLRTFPPQAFWPPPKIESSLVRLTREDRLGDAARARAFSRFLHKLFSARRKTLRRALEYADIAAGDELAQSLRIDPQVRAETLTPPTILALFDATQSMERTGAAPS